MLTQERLKELLAYDPETGLFIRLQNRPGPGARAGDAAGSVQPNDYRRIFVDGKGYKAHRLAWFYVHGEWPSEIDHINCNKDDNRLANLRVVSRSQNRMNVRAYASNKSGYRGVSLYKPTNRWKAQIQVDGRKKALGYYATPEDAYAAYCEASTRLHGEHGRVR
jgi:hypothetical protein